MKSSFSLFLRSLSSSLNSAFPFILYLWIRIRPTTYSDCEYYSVRFSYLFSLAAAIENASETSDLATPVEEDSFYEGRGRFFF